MNYKTCFNWSTCNYEIVVPVSVIVFSDFCLLRQNGELWNQAPVGVNLALLYATSDNVVMKGHEMYSIYKIIMEPMNIHYGWCVCVSENAWHELKHWPHCSTYISLPKESSIQNIWCESHS